METLNFPMLLRGASFEAQSYNAERNTVDILWTTGATVRRNLPAFAGGPFDEQLIVTPEAVRMARLNSGAPFLDSHDKSSLSSVLGAVVPGTAKLSRGQGTATVMLSRAANVADIVQNIRDGIIRNVSVGYRIHTIEKAEQDSKIPLLRVIDWEPFEISAVTIGADAGTGIRSEGGPDTMFPCVIARAEPGRGVASELHAIRMRLRQRQAMAAYR